MIREVYVAIGITCMIAVVRWVWKIVNWVWFEPIKLEKLLRKQGLKGTSYKFFVGDMKDLYKMQNEAKQKPFPFTHDYIPRVLPFEHQCANQYGRDLMFKWMGPVPMINIREPKLMREALTKMNDFQKPKLSPLVALLTPGLVSLEGEKWAMHRRLINPAFHMEKLKLMISAMYDSTNELVNKWEDMTSNTGSIELDVFPYLEDHTAEVISRAGFGITYEESRSFFECLKEQGRLVLRLIHVGYIPGWKYVPTKSNRRLNYLSAEINRLLKGMIDNRKKAMQAGEVVKNDLLGILIESNFKETQNDGGQSKGVAAMSLQEAIDECKLFYLAAYETTSAFLVWTLVLLSKYPFWQTRAREEILASFGKDQPDFDGLNRLKIVTIILYEVLRLYPPVFSVIRRLFNGETMLGDIIIPQGTLLNLSILEMHHDPALWGDDAMEFKPERFAEGIAKATKGNLSFFPFGGGPRICLGQNFALTEAKMALAVILRRFSLELSPSYTHAPTSFTTIRPLHGAHLILRRL